MSVTPSIGDIMMLSQLAWKIGCAFTSGKSGAPAEFQEVKNELTSLTKSIDMLAEALDNDDSIITKADEKTKEGLDKILECCRQTLQNLDSFVDQYQDLRRPEEGAVAARSWKPILLRNYKKIWWTTEGGNIQALRDMLQMHVSSISLTVQALQSKSLSRLEKTIEPMADKVEGIHTKLNGDLDVKVAEIHQLMLSMATIERSPNLTPSDSSTMPPGPTTSLAVASSSASPSPKPVRSGSGNYKHPFTPEMTPEMVGSEFSPQSSRALSPGESPGMSPGTISMNEFDPRRGSDMMHISEHYRLPSYYNEPPPEYKVDRRSVTSDLSARLNLDPNQNLSVNAGRSPSLGALGIQSLTPVTLPPPILSPEQDMQDMRPRNASVTDVPAADPPLESVRAFSTISQQDMFERRLFGDAATLCDARGASIEYTQPDPECPGEWKMIEATGPCRISIITKKQQLSAGSTRYITSVWAISDDRGVRMQQKLADGEEVIPYTVWGNKSKVVLRVPAELKFHDVEFNSKPKEVVKTSWINYVFEDEQGSTLFQNALMGKTLLLSVKTKRTMRIHDTLIGNTFALQEQLCGLENLRIWQDDDMAGVLAMIHYSAQFRDGYLAFRLNCPPRNTVRVRDDGDRFVRIKGLAVQPVTTRNVFERRESVRDVKSPVRHPSPKSPGSKKEKKISAVKIEFESEVEKRTFLDKVREIQGSASW